MSKLVLQPTMSSSRPGVGVNVAVVVMGSVLVAVAVTGVVEGTSVNVMIKGRAVVVGVADGMNGGVGDRIAGMDEGETTGVIIAKGMFRPLQAARKKRAVKAKIVFIMIASGLQYYP